MSDDGQGDDGWEMIEESELPALDTEEGRDAWIEILMQQDDETLRLNETNWIKCLTISDGKNMIARFVYEDGTEEVFDLEVRRSIVHVPGGDPEAN